MQIVTLVLQISAIIMFCKAFTCFVQSKLLKRIILTVIIVFLFIYVLTPKRFAAVYPYINEIDIEHELEPQLTTKDIRGRPLCPLVPQNLSNEFLYPNVSVTNNSLEDIADNYKVKWGGLWEPEHCASRFDVAIIIPYRNRFSHLRIFLVHMHPFLQQQNIAYRFFVIEQTDKHAFNRGKLFNIGFAEADKYRQYHCYIFHDVDLIPQKLKNIYACTRQPRHMSSSVNTFRYNLPYRDLFGGAVAILRNQFRYVNGFSNMFFGWGGEDDDFHGRVISKGLSVCRFDPNVARYFMLTHPKAPPSEARFINLNSGAQRFNSDGLNTLSYEVINVEYTALYTKILVEV